MHSERTGFPNRTECGRVERDRVTAAVNWILTAGARLLQVREVEDQLEQRRQVELTRRRRQEELERFIHALEGDIEQLPNTEHLQVCVCVCVCVCDGGTAHLCVCVCVYVRRRHITSLCVGVGRGWERHDVWFTQHSRTNPHAIFTHTGHVQTQREFEVFAGRERCL